jgi:hypothetical protein
VNVLPQPGAMPVIPSMPQLESSVEAVAVAMYMEQVKYHARKVAQDQEKYVTMYATVWNYLSSESQLQIKGTPDWTSIEESQDTVRLHARIVITHQSGDARIAPLALKLAKTRYEQCRKRRLSH